MSIALKKTAPKKLAKGVGKAVTTKSHKTGVVEEVQEDVGEPKMFTDPPCKVGMDASMTINLGDFNSVKLGCSLHVPCEHSEIDEAFDFAKDWVNERLGDMVAEVKE